MYNQDIAAEALLLAKIRPSGLTEAHRAQLSILDVVVPEPAAVTKATPSPAPRVKAVVVDGEDWGQTVKRNRNVPVTFGVLDECINAIVDLVKQRCGTLQKRIDELESRSSGVEWKGVYADGRAYKSGDLTTRSGSLWVATQDTTERPGNSGSWKLIVKAGSLAHD